MEKNNTFSWNIFKIFSSPNNNNLQGKKITYTDDLKETQKFIYNEEYFDKKLNIQKEKYNIDLGACIINSNNQILCFNKNTINNHSNSYFKVDKFIIEDSNENAFVAKSIYSEFNGPRFRVTNVKKIFLKNNINQVSFFKTK